MRSFAGYLLLALSLSSATAAPPARAGDGSQAAYQDSYDLEAAGKYGAALAVLDGLPAAAKGTYTHALRRGWLAYLAGKNATAVEAYRAAITLAPKAIEPYLGLLLPQMVGRQWSEVDKTASAALALDPNNATALGKRAWALYSLGRFGDAAGVYQKVLALYPSDIEMRAGLGWSLLKQGKAEAAATELRAVLAVAPKHATARAGLEALGQQL